VSIERARRSRSCGIALRGVRERIVATRSAAIMSSDVRRGVQLAARGATGAMAGSAEELESYAGRFWSVVHMCPEEGTV